MLWKRRETTYSIKLGNEPLSNVAKLNLKSLIAFTGAIIGVATASYYLMNYYEKLEDPDRDFISTYYEKRVFNTDPNLADTICHEIANMGYKEVAKKLAKELIELAEKNSKIAKLFHDKFKLLKECEKIALIKRAERGRLSQIE